MPTSRSPRSTSNMSAAGVSKAPRRPRTSQRRRKPARPFVNGEIIEIEESTDEDEKPVLIPPAEFRAKLEGMSSNGHGRARSGSGFSPTAGSFTCPGPGEDEVTRKGKGKEKEKDSVSSPSNSYERPTSTPPTYVFSPPMHPMPHPNQVPQPPTHPHHAPQFNDDHASDDGDSMILDINDYSCPPRDPPTKENMPALYASFLAYMHPVVPLEVRDRASLLISKCVERVPRYGAANVAGSIWDLCRLYFRLLDGEFSGWPAMLASIFEGRHNNGWTPMKRDFCTTIYTWLAVWELPQFFDYLYQNSRPSEKERWPVPFAEEPLFLEYKVLEPPRLIGEANPAFSPDVFPRLTEAFAFGIDGYENTVNQVLAIYAATANFLEM